MIDIIQYNQYIYYKIKGYNFDNKLIKDKKDIT